MPQYPGVRPRTARRLSSLVVACVMFVGLGGAREIGRQPEAGGVGYVTPTWIGSSCVCLPFSRRPNQCSQYGHDGNF